MVIALIISFIFFLSGAIFLGLACKKRIDNSKLQLQRNQLESEYHEMQLSYDILQDRYGEARHDYQELRAQDAQLNEDLKAKQVLVENYLATETKKAQEQLDTFKINSQYAMEQYISSIEEGYNKADADFDKKIEQKNQEYTKIVSEVDSIRATLAAATEARIREEEKKGNLDFYKLQITSIELDDIVKLNSIKPMLHNPVVLSKLIWTTYYQKPYKALCSRVLSDITVIGIYKITDLTTEQCYIGQSVDIAKRWSDHIKAGLGIDNNGTNKLYKAMQAHGVHNFTFELLEACDRKNLDEKEKFFIGLYQSDKFGLNATKGNG